MSTKGKEYQLAIRIAGTVDRSFPASLTAANSSLRKTVAAIDRDFDRLDKGFDSIAGVGKRCFTAAAASASVAAVAIGAAVADCTKEAATFEHQMADVTKYVNGLADAAGRASDAMALDNNGDLLNGKTYAENYQGMKSALLDLSTQIPMTAEELTKLSAAAGQSGYDVTSLLQYDSAGNIEGFLRDTAVMGTAMDISAEQAGDWSAKWEKAFGKTHDEIMVLADQINYLGANSATTAAEIAQVVNDAASLGQIAGMDVSTTAALADAMLATGVGSDKVATSVKRTITNLSMGERATKAMKVQWEELGFTAEGVAMAMQDDSIGTLKGVFEAIGNLPDYKQVSALSTLFGQWAIEGDAKIVGNMKVFQDALDMVSDPSKYSGSMEREFTIKASTSESIDTMVGNAFRAMKINIGDSFLPIKKEYSEELISFIGEMTERMSGFNKYLASADGLSKWMKNAEAQFPTLRRKFDRFAAPVFSGIMDGGKWIVRHGNGIISVIAGIGTALTAYKIASNVSHIADSLIGLTKGQWAISGIMALIGALGTAYAAYKQHERDMVDQDLAAHFGNIALSMEELEKAAEHIIGSESLGGVRKALEAFDDLEGISATMQDTLSDIDKLNWKVSIGMELTEEENESYKQAIDDYVKAAQEYALQSQYGVALNLQVAFSEDDLEGQDVVAKVNRFYQDRYDELSSLGTQLNEALTDAFNDGLLDIKETKVIADIQRQMAEIEEAMATGEFDASLSVLGMEYAGGGSLTADSFMNLQKELSDQVAEASNAYQESYTKNYAAIQAAYEAGDYLDGAEYQKALENLQTQYLENVGEIKAKAINFQLETIMAQYAGEIDPAIEGYIRNAQETMASYAEKGVSGWMDAPVTAWDAMLEKLDYSGMDKSTRMAIAQLLEAMLPSIEEMQSMREQYEEAGKEIPESFISGLSSFAMLDVLSQAGLDYDSVGNVLGEQLVNSGQYEGFYRDMMEELKASDAYVPEAVARGVSNAAAAATAESVNAAADSSVRPAVEGMHTRTQQIINEYYAQGFQATADVEISLNPILRGSMGGLLNGSLGNVAKVIGGLGSLDIDRNADGGIIRNKELSWLAEKGPEAVIPLDGSRNAISLWEETGKLLGMEGAFDGLDLGSSEGATVQYSPVLNFYGAAPSRDDLTEALDISQEKFDRMMDRYFKTRSRVSFG
ncbi:phage tail tape measure protein [uncultured Acetatifactor sp.]|uniref:phage tail tape measure protein n=1 Tax=uncultured Acetatifactor sp. TaxID=1671927 RepID=UPI00263142B6|nr:phage tail tape measure protein [uncultured Acetatifactor sp.]